MESMKLKEVNSLDDVRLWGIRPALIMTRNLVDMLDDDSTDSDDINILANEIQIKLEDTDAAFDHVAKFYEKKSADLDEPELEFFEVTKKIAEAEKLGLDHKAFLDAYIKSQGKKAPELAC